MNSCFAGIERNGRKAHPDIIRRPQQRVALGRHIMAEPQILLLDEPFAALDNLMRSKLRLDLMNIHKKYHTPIILVTHI
jgi:ABC-type sulfate/molybdate transport systems ATPase subunit